MSKKTNGCNGNGMPRRVAYTKRKSGTRSLIIVGVDPGLASTGVTVLKKYPGGRIEVLFSKTIRTKKNPNLRERTQQIADEVVSICVEYKAKTVVCEAFEVRGWQKPQKSSQSMSKLINAISIKATDKNLLFCLSSPDMKKRTEWEIVSLEMPVEGCEKVKSCHARDAGLHGLLYLRGDLSEKLGIN